MTDLSKTIAPRSDQQNYDDFLAGPRTIKITRVTGNESSDDQPVSIYFEGDNNKPYKPAKSMRRVLVQVWGGDGNLYVGRSMTLYGDPEVKFGGIKVGGIRISHMSDIDKPVSLMLTQTRGKKAEYIVRPLAGSPDQEVLLKAKEAARKGTEAFTAFWNSDEGKKMRDKLRPHMDELSAIGKAADEASKTLSQKLAEGNPDQPPAETPNAATGAATDPDSEPWKEGYTDADNLNGRDTCPYADDPDRANWLAGWDKRNERDQ